MLEQTSLLLLCLTVATINAFPCDHITGGIVASEAAYKYQVSIRNKGDHVCSGAIIDQRHILTSRYCLGSILLQDLTVVAGTNSLKEGGKIFTVLNTILPEDLQNDIAIIRTTENITFDDKIQFITITDKDYRNDGTPILITGWGSLINGVVLTELLQEIHIRLFDQDQCMKKYGAIDESKFCTFEKNSTHLCHIDVGSPLVADGVLIGVKSLGYNCGLDKADMHTRVYHYLKWIKSNTQVESETTTTASTTTIVTSEVAYKYQVSIRNKGNHVCSGAIIDQRHILTSRYCLGSILLQDLTVVAGTNSLKEGGKIFNVQKTILHEDLQNDIAIIRTIEKIPFDDKIQFITITDKDYRNDGTPILITGWGSLINGVVLTELLQEIHIRLFDQDQCMKKYDDIDESKFCTIEKCGTHLCHIDIGSPLVADGVLIGVKSLGYNCGLDKADMHTRVYHYLEWIKLNIQIELETTTTTSTTALPITVECF